MVHASAHGGCCDPHPAGLRYRPGAPRHAADHAFCRILVLPLPSPAVYRIHRAAERPQRCLVCPRMKRLAKTYAPTPTLGLLLAEGGGGWSGSWSSSLSLSTSDSDADGSASSSALPSRRLSFENRGSAADATVHAKASTAPVLFVCVEVNGLQLALAKLNHVASARQSCTTVL